MLLNKTKKIIIKRIKNKKRINDVLIILFNDKEYLNLRLFEYNFSLRLCRNRKKRFLKNYVIKVFKYMKEPFFEYILVLILNEFKGIIFII
jgi:hypothetical protein